MSKRKDIKEYINEVSKIHNNYYDYSLVKYKSMHDKIIIICPKHGEFKQTPLNHKKSGCKHCGKLLDQEIILQRIKNIHGDKYDYSKFIYYGMYKKSIIICPIHGEFKQTVINHLAGKGCKKCALNCKKTLSQIIKKLNKIHDNKYDYSLLSFKKNRDVVNIICPIHGVFEQILNNHLRGNGCQLCKESKGEKQILFYLKEKNIKFIRQYKFKRCSDKNLLPFDFYLPEFNMCIEFDGQQHFKKVLNWDFENIKKHDKIKNVFCDKNDIRLIRISYKDNINEKMNEIFNKLLLQK